MAAGVTHGQRIGVFEYMKQIASIGNIHGKTVKMGWFALLRLNRDKVVPEALPDKAPKPTKTHKPTKNHMNPEHPEQVTKDSPIPVSYTHLTLPTTPYV